MIYWELRKGLKLNHSGKSYIHKLEFIQENQTHRIDWDFEIQTDRQIAASKPDQVLIEKKN